MLAQVLSLLQFVGACNGSPLTGSQSSSAAGGSLTPTPSPLDIAVRGASPLSNIGSSTLDLLSSGGSSVGSSGVGDSSIPNITPDLEQIISILYGDSGEGASLHKEPDPKQAKESAAQLAHSTHHSGTASNKHRKQW